jgi:cysteinyl-tRNA synthetase
MIEVRRNPSPHRPRPVPPAVVVLATVVAVVAGLGGCGTDRRAQGGSSASAASPMPTAGPMPTVSRQDDGTAPAVPDSSPTALHRSTPAVRGGNKRITGWVYQLQGYPRGRLDQIAQAPYPVAVIDLARDAATDYFRRDEIERLHRSGKRVLAYFEIGSIEDFRPEYPGLRRDSNDLILNLWPDWPEEYFVRYWDERWWDRVVRPRVDRAITAGFDGVYLDTPLAYEELDLALVPGRDRPSLARAMVRLIQRISTYAKARRPGFWVFPQNSPELRHYPGYTAAIDGIGVEELFYLATDVACTEDFCGENLRDVRALRRAGKLVLAVDYARRAGNVRAACGRYAAEGFAGYVTVRDLDRISPPCG